MVQESTSPWASPIVLVRTSVVDFAYASTIDDSIRLLSLMHTPSPEFMERCFGDQSCETLMFYLDDVIVFSPDFSTHLERLDMVFSRLAKHGLKAKPSKCHLLKKSINFLGHVASEHGIRTDPEKCQALETWPTPSTPKEVRQFLGFVRYYRRFVKDFSKIAQPLFVLTGQPKKGKKPQRSSPFRWTPECQRAFDKLRKYLMSRQYLLIRITLSPELKSLSLIVKLKE